jgi:hypothetical protein
MKMAQRNSGYERKPSEFYETPAWVTEAVVPYLRGGPIWEPAAGGGTMLKVLRTRFLSFGSDIEPAAHGIHELDFLAADTRACTPKSCGAIVTNPPYSMAPEFCRHALKMMGPVAGQVAMLLRVDFDSGKTRRDLFQDNPAWAKKIVLLDRIEWFEPEPGKGGPSENHAWYLWDFQHKGDPAIRYATKQLDEI